MLFVLYLPGYSALYLAARNGDLEVVKNVVEGGGTVDIQTSWGEFFVTYHYYY